MKQFQCKKCNSTDITITFGINPNDKTPAKTLMLEEVRNNTTKADSCWCNYCKSHTEASIVYMPKEYISEEELFQGWVLGEEDLYLASISQYKEKVKGEPKPEDDIHMTGGHFVQYTGEGARKAVNDYVSLYIDYLDSNMYIHVQLRKIEFSYQQRREFDCEFSLVESLDLEAIEVFYEKTYKNKNNHD